MLRPRVGRRACLADGAGVPLAHSADYRRPQEQVERAFQFHLAELGFNVGCDLLTDRERAGLC